MMSTARCCRPGTASPARHPPLRSCSRRQATPSRGSATSPRTRPRKVREQFYPLTAGQVEVLSAPIEPGRTSWPGRDGPNVRECAATDREAAGRRQHALVDLAVRCIAALGPLTVDQLALAITEAARLGFSAAYRAPMVVHVDAGRGRFALIDQLGRGLRHRPPGDHNGADAC